MLFLMKERLQHHLHPETQKALKLAHRLSGKASLFKWVDDLPHNTRGVVKRPPVPNRPYEIWWRKGVERVLNHLITREVGRIVRLHRVPEVERLAPFISVEAREFAAEQLADNGELDSLLQDGQSPETLGEMMQDWHEAIAEQVADGPVDLRIEQRIFDHFPGLRTVQGRSLAEEVARRYESVPSVCSTNGSSQHLLANASDERSACLARGRIVRQAGDSRTVRYAKASRNRRGARSTGAGRP